MKKLFVIISMFLLHTADAQEKINLNIVYEVSYTRDLGNAANPVVTKEVLSIGNNTARFVSKSIFDNNSKAIIEERKKRMEQMKAQTSSTITVVTGSPVLSITNSGAIVNEELMTEQSKKLSVSGRLGLKTYTYTSAVPGIKWTLQNDKKKILGYYCQKAIGDFAGRTYEAWFTNDIPYSFGPWKLGGLPGLILEAQDSKNEIRFTAQEITKNTDAEERVVAYMQGDYAIPVKEKEYKETLKMLVSDPESITSAQFPNTKVMIRNRENPNDKTIIKVKKYNPIELR